MNARLVEKTPSAYHYPLLIKNLLTHSQRCAPWQEIVYQGRHRCTYRTFAERIARLANALQALGVRPGDTVAVMDWDSHRYLECYFAVPMIGAVLHTINIRLSAEQLLYTINHARDDIIVAHTDFIPLLEKIAPQFDAARPVVTIEEDDVAPASRTLRTVGEYEALLADQAPVFTFPDFDENAAATLFYTTGTTGRPKGVCFSHRQIVLHTYGFMSALCAFHGFADIDASDVYMPLTPMFHVHAWGMPYLFTMLAAKQVYVGRYEPGKILSLLAAEGATFSHCVPTILKMVLDHPEAAATDLSDWKILVGGSALPQSLCAAAMSRGINVFAAYGMSETCPLVTLAMPDPGQAGDGPAFAQRCRTGMPVPHVDLNIVDGHGRFLPHDGRQTGEVVVRSPWLAQAYFREPEKSEDLWRGGWMHTGDVGCIGADGFLQITDRIKDVIKTGGEWLSSLTLEDLISRHEAVGEAAVIGVPDPKWGERPIALVVLKAEFAGPLNEDDLKEHLRQFADKGVIPRYGVPDRIHIVAALAKTSVGKLDKKRLRRQYGSI